MHRKPYCTDLTDGQWRVLQRVIPEQPKRRGRRRKYPLRELVNALAYLVRTGCAWRMLPHDLPPWWNVYYLFRQWRDTNWWLLIHKTLRALVRQARGRNREPSAAIIDSQSVKTAQGGVRGYDAGKKVTGRKRHILVDTEGFLLTVVVHSADIQDRDGGKQLLRKARGTLPRLQRIWADAGYAGKLVQWTEQRCQWLLEIVRRTGKGFQVLPRRWVVERTFGWFSRYRRLSKDYEYHTRTSEAMLYLAMLHLLLRRAAALGIL